MFANLWITIRICTCIDFNKLLFCSYSCGYLLLLLRQHRPSEKLNKSTAHRLTHLFTHTTVNIRHQQRLNLTKEWRAKHGKCKCDISQNLLRSADCADRGKARESSSPQPPSLLPLSNELCTISAFRSVRKVRHYRDRGTRHCYPHRLPLQTHCRYPGSLRFGVHILVIFSSWLVAGKDGSCFCWRVCSLLLPLIVFSFFVQLSGDFAVRELSDFLKPSSSTGLTSLLLRTVPIYLHQCWPSRVEPCRWGQMFEIQCPLCRPYRALGVAVGCPSVGASGPSCWTSTLALPTAPTTPSLSRNPVGGPQIQ